MQKRTALVFALLVAPAMGQAPAAPYTERVSETAVGGEANNESRDPHLSADGRYVVFYSRANNLTSGQVATQDGLPDIFRRDLWTGQVLHVSRNGTTDSNGIESQPAISPDGNFVVWASTSTNLVAGLPVAVPQILMCDTTTMSIRLVSKFQGAPGATNSGQPDVAANGSAVVFRNAAGTGAMQICLWQQAVDDAFPITWQAGPILGYGNGDSFDPHITANGRLVVYSTTATNVVGNDQNGAAGDVHLVDTVTRQVIRVSQTAQGTQPTTASIRPTIDDSGNRVVFLANTNVFTGGNPSALYQAYMLDRTTGQFTLVSVDDAGVPSAQSCDQAAICRQGRRVAFLSRGANLGGSNPAFVTQAWLRDLDTNRTTQLSRSDAGTPADQPVASVDIDGSGLWAVFDSPSPVLEVGDTNGVDDVFASFCGARNLAAANTGPGIVSSLRPSRAFSQLRLHTHRMRDLTVEPIGGQACASTCRVSIVREPGGGFAHGVMDCNGTFTPNGDLGSAPATGLGDLVTIATTDDGELALVVTTQAALMLFRPLGLPFMPYLNPLVVGLPAGPYGRMRLAVVRSTYPRQVRLYYTDATLDAIAVRSLLFCETANGWDCNACPFGSVCQASIDATLASIVPFDPLPGIDAAAVPGQPPEGHRDHLLMLARRGQNGVVLHMSSSATIGGRGTKVLEAEGLSFLSLSWLGGKALLLGHDNRVYELDLLSQHSAEIQGAVGGTVTYRPLLPPAWIDQGGLFLMCYGTPLATPVPIPGLLGTQLALTNLVPTDIVAFPPGQTPTHQLQVPAGFPATGLHIQLFATPLLGGGALAPHGGNVADVFVR